MSAVTNDLRLYDVDYVPPTPEQLGETKSDKDCFLYVVDRVEKCLSALDKEGTILKGVTFKSNPLFLQSFNVFFNRTAQRKDLVIDVYNSTRFYALHIGVSKGNFPARHRQTREAIMHANNVRSVQSITSDHSQVGDDFLHVSNVDTYLINMENFVRNAAHNDLRLKAPALEQV